VDSESIRLTGVVTTAMACKDAQPWKVGIGLFLARGAGKPKDLEVKLSVMRSQRRWSIT